MKTINLFFISFLFILFACSEKTEDETVPESPDDDVIETRGSSNQQVKFAAIAQTDPQTGEIKLLVEKLVNTFPDGGQIKYYLVRNTGAEYGFVRIGQDIKGNHRAEAFKTVTQGNRIGLIVTHELVWQVACQGSCFGCMPNSEGTNCECDTYLGDDGKVFDYAGQEVDDVDLDGQIVVGATNCNFGTSGGGVYATQVFR